MRTSARYIAYYTLLNLVIQLVPITAAVAQQTMHLDSLKKYKGSRYRSSTDIKEIRKTLDHQNLYVNSDSWRTQIDEWLENTRFNQVQNNISKWMLHDFSKLDDPDYSTKSIYDKIVTILDKNVRILTVHTSSEMMMNQVVAYIRKENDFGLIAVARHEKGAVKQYKIDVSIIYMDRHSIVPEILMLIYRFEKELEFKNAELGFDYLNKLCIKACPNHRIEILDAQAEYYRRRGKYHKSIAVLQNIQNLDPEEKNLKKKLRRYYLKNKIIHEPVSLRLAHLYYLQGRYQEAENILKREKFDSIEMYADYYGWLRLRRLGAIYGSQGEYAKALTMFQQARKYAKKRGAKTEMKTLHNIGMSNIYMNKNAKGIAQLLLVRDFFYDLWKNPNNSLDEYNEIMYDIAYVHSSLGKAYLRQRKFQDALRECWQALLIWKYSNEVTEQIENLVCLADTYSASKNYEFAEKYYDKALLHAQLVQGDISKELSKIHSSTSSFYFERGNWLLSAHHSNESVRILAERARRHLAFAERLVTGKFRTSLARNKKVVTQHIKSTYREQFNLTIGRNKVKNSISDLQKRRFVKNKRPFEKTFKSAQLGLDSASVVARSLLLAAARDAAPSLLGRLIRDRQDLAEEWRNIDARLYSKNGAMSDRPGSVRLKSYRHRLKLIDQRLSEIDSELGGKFAEYLALIVSKPTSLTELRHGAGGSFRLGNRHSSRALLGANEALVLFLDTPALKPTPEETFVWVVTRDDVRWFQSFLGTEALKDRVSSLRCGLDVGNWSRDEKTAEWRPKARRCIDRLGGELKFSTPPFNNKALSIAHELYEELLRPAESLIKGKELIIVPSGALTALPFHVLVTEAPDLTITDMRVAHRKAAWLGRRHAITMLPSVSSLQALRRTKNRKRAPSPFIGIGNPLLVGRDGTNKSAWKYQECRKALKFASETGNRSSSGNYLREKPKDVAAIRRLVRHQRPLPDTAGELCAVGGGLGAQEDAIHLGGGATETKIRSLNKRGDLARARVVHFATHAVIPHELKDLAQAAILLTPPPDGDKDAAADDDGRLTPSEVAQLKLNADLVILSACNTAAGDKPGAEALSGLARAFFYAGARALLVTHWPVDSAAAADLITRTMQQLQDNEKLSRGQALRQTMEELLQSEPPAGLGSEMAFDKAHPAYWAPFVIVGDAKA